MVDSPAWHLVKALDTLVSDDGNVIMIDNYPKPLPLNADEKAMIEKASRRAAKRRQKSNTVCSTGSTICHGSRQTNASNRSRREHRRFGRRYTGPGGKTICRIAP